MRATLSLITSFFLLQSVFAQFTEKPGDLTGTYSMLEKRGDTFVIPENCWTREIDRIVISSYLSEEDSAKEVFEISFQSFHASNYQVMGYHYEEAAIVFETIDVNDVGEAVFDVIYFRISYENEHVIKIEELNVSATYYAVSTNIHEMFELERCAEE